MMKTLKIKIINDKRVYEGSPIEIIEQMKYLAWGWESKPVDEYIEWMISQLKTYNEIEITIAIVKDNPEIMAEQFIDALLVNKLAYEVE